MTAHSRSSEFNGTFQTMAAADLFEGWFGDAEAKRMKKRRIGEEARKRRRCRRI